jgi:hypothetical protein
MKKSIIVLSIALLVVSLGASLAMAAPQGMMGSGMGQMMNADQMNEQHNQMNNLQNDGMKMNNIQDAPCLQNSSPAK